MWMLLTTQAPDTVLLARNVHVESAGSHPRVTIWFFVQLYDGNWTDDPAAVLSTAASMPRTSPRGPSFIYIDLSASKDDL